MKTMTKFSKIEPGETRFMKPKFKKSEFSEKDMETMA
jgi:hypothetical protein